MPSKQDLCPSYLCHPVSKLTAPRGISSVNSGAWRHGGWWNGAWEDRSGGLKGQLMQLLPGCKPSGGVACPSSEHRLPGAGCSRGSSDCGPALPGVILSHSASDSVEGPREAPGTGMLLAQSGHSQVTKRSGFLGTGVWTVTLWGAIKGRNKNALGNRCLPTSP